MELEIIEINDPQKLLNKVYWYFSPDVIKGSDWVSVRVNGSVSYEPDGNKLTLFNENDEPILEVGKNGEKYYIDLIEEGERVITEKKVEVVMDFHGHFAIRVC